MIDKINAIAQVFGGKFIFTVVTAGIFAYAVVSKVLNGEQTYGIIMLVVAFYFSKQTTVLGGTGNGQQTTTVSAPDNASVAITSGPGAGGTQP